MPSNKKQILEFHYDISCPFAYIASTRIEALAARTNALLKWSPVLLGAIYRETAAPQGAAGSASDVFNPTKKAVSSRAFARTIRRYNLPFNQPPAHPQRTPDALRLLYAVSNEDRPALTHALFNAYWVENRNVGDRSVLLDVAKSVLPSTSTVSDATFGSAEAQEALRDATAKVIARGAPGVPSFWVPGENWTDAKNETPQGRLYWGQDRMHFVEAVLMALSRGVKYEEVPSLKGLQPRCLRPPRSLLQTRQTKVEFWYDFSSPWAFLGWTQLERLRREAGPGLQIEMKPILVGALFRDIGAPMVPMLVVSEQKRTYSNQDLRDWVRHWNALNTQEKTGRPISFRFPDTFPIRSPTLLRCAIVEPSLTPVLYSACWERNLPVSTASALTDVLSRAGHNAPEILKAASTTRVKEILRGNNNEAVELGICGVPTYRISEKTGTGWVVSGVGTGIVWGQDELAVVQDLIAGWKEEECRVTADVSRAHQVGKREGGKGYRSAL